mmetsp:Transcript_11052/g.31307  ORF Transcript_11052/g.31307 Transcript_11052/m.31307 type:complete len:251 (-) Transcript_11052:193-945(-)
MTSHPRRLGLVGMERHCARIGARGDVEQMPPSRQCVLVIKQVVVPQMASTVRVHTFHQELVLAGVLGRQGTARFQACQEEVHSRRVEHLERAHEAELEAYVLDVHGAVAGAQLGQVLAQAVREEHGVGVRLHRPLVLPVPAVRLDLVPDLCEGEGVGNGAPLSRRALLPLIHRGLLTGENAEPFRLHSIDEGLLVAHLHAPAGGHHAVGGHYGEAEERLPPRCSTCASCWHCRWHPCRRSCRHCWCCCWC